VRLGTAFSGFILKEPNMTKRAALYARVSTAAGQSPQMQIDCLREYAQRRGLEIIEEYIDNGISGTKDRRPALDRLMDASRRRQHDMVLVYRFDRMARSTSHLLRVLEEFEGLGINFVSYSEGLELGSALGRAMFTIIGALAELERNLIVERSTEGQRRARARGKHVGRPRKAVDTDMILHLRQREGLSLRAIAQRLGISTTIVQRAIREAQPAA
jgi:DNA invertase Pin-like site-specific DNA recombinase